MIWYERDIARSLHRWCCSCGQFGIWLVHEDKVQRNSDLHAQAHGTQLAIRPLKVKP